MIRYNSLKEAGAFISYILIKDLQKSFPKLAGAYSQIFRGKPKIAINSATQITLSGSSGDGYKAIAVLYHDEQIKVIEGSWGGSNMFVATPVDDYKKPIPIHSGDAIMECQVGAHESCTLYIHPDNIAKMLPPPEGGDITSLEKLMLGILVGLISSARLEEFKNGLQGSNYTLSQYAKGITKEDIKKDLDIVLEALNGSKKIIDIWKKVAEGLQAKKLVKISSNGAVALTIEGKSMARRNAGW